MAACKHVLVEWEDITKHIETKGRKTHGDVDKFSSVPTIRCDGEKYAVHYCPDCRTRLEWVAK